MRPDDGSDSPPHPFILPPGFLDAMPTHLRDPYYPQQPEPESDPEEEDPEELALDSEPEEDPEELEPKAIVPELGHDYAAPSGTDSEPDDGLQPYGNWDEEEVQSDGTDDLDDAVVVNPPYPIRSRAEPLPSPSFATYRDPGGMKWRYTPRKVAPSRYFTDLPRSSPIGYSGHQDPYDAGPSYSLRDPGESSRGGQRPAFEPYHSRGPGETLGELRHRVAQLEAHTAFLEEAYRPLTSASFMHGIHIKVLEQDRDRLEAIRLASQEEDEDRLRTPQDRKRKGPAE